MWRVNDYGIYLSQLRGSYDHLHGSLHHIDSLPWLHRLPLPHEGAFKMNPDPLDAAEEEAMDAFYAELLSIPRPFPWGDEVMEYILELAGPEWFQDRFDFGDS
jgi:hypothetical protein